VVTATVGVAAGTELEQKGSPQSGSVVPWLGTGLPRRIPVKSSVPCPKEKIPELLADLYRIKLPLPVKAGATVIADWQGTGIDIVTVRTLG
jgi:CxxC motif-containing protein